MKEKENEGKEEERNESEGRREEVSCRSQLTVWTIDAAFLAMASRRGGGAPPMM